MIQASQIIKMELGGLFGSRVLKDFNTIMGYYSLYDEPELWDQYDGEEMDYTPTTKTTNYVKKLIDDQARFMLSETPLLTINTENKDDAVVLNDYIEDVLDRNLFASKLVSAGRDCFIGGRVALKLYIDEHTQDINIQFYPALEFIYEPCEKNPNELRKIIFFHQMNEEDTRDKQRIWKQKYELDEAGRCLLTEGVYNGHGDPVPGEHLIENQVLQINFIPAYVILNSGLTGDLKGQSDVEDIKSNAVQYNKLSSIDIDTLIKGMNQIITLTDVEPDCFDYLANKAGAVWDLKTAKTAKDSARAVVNTIEANFGYSERIDKCVTGIKTDMHDLMSIPFITIEDLQGAITSGKGMEALYWKQIIRCKEKWADWKPALQWMIKAILELTETFGIAKLPSIDSVRVSAEIRFPLPQDTEKEKEEDANDVSNGVMSKKRYLMKWHNMTEEEAEAELIQIQKEASMLDSINNYSNLGSDPIE